MNVITVFHTCIYIYMYIKYMYVCMYIHIYSVPWDYNVYNVM